MGLYNANKEWYGFVILYVGYPGSLNVSIIIL